MRPLWWAMLLGLMCLSVTPAAVALEATPDAGGTVARAAYTTMSSTEFENRLVTRTNVRRAQHGCRPLELNASLALAARRHSARMADDHELSHRLADEPGLVSRAVNAGYTNWRLLAENLAWGQATPGAVFRAWVRSAGHRANLDNCRLRDVGVGVVIRRGRPWVTEDFGRREP